MTLLNYRNSILWILIGTVSGVLSSYYALPLPFWPIVIAAALSSLSRRTISLGLCCLAAVLFSSYTQYTLSPTPEPTQLTVTQNPERTASGRYKFLAKSAAGTVLAYSKQPVAYGDVLAIKARLLTISPPTNPGQFDYPTYLKTNRIKHVLSIRSFKKIGEKKNPVKVVSYWIKKHILALHRRTLEQPYADLFTGLIFGEDQTDLPDEMSDAFQRTGLTHLLVVSGSQVALISGILYNLLLLFGIRELPKVLIIGLVNIIFYFVTGGGSAILRAMIMMMLILSIKLLQRKVTPLHVLSLTCVVMLSLNPLNLFNVGAQLSFLATAALIFGAPVAQSWCPESWPAWVRTTIGITIAPFVFTAPLLWLMFNQISWISLLTNLVVGFAIEWLVIIGFFSTLVGLVIYPIALIVNNFCWLVMVAMHKFVMMASQWPAAVTSASPPPVWIIVVCYLAIALVCTRHRKIQPKWVIGSTVCLLAGLIVTNILMPRPLVVTMLDVGQGDCIVIQTPSNQTILIDAGPLQRNFLTKKIVQNAGRQVVGPALRYFGISTIELAVLTHPDLDHNGGYAFLERQFQFKEMIKSPKPVSSEIFTFRDGVTLQLFYPDPMATSKNDASIAMKLCYKDVSFLFTGDLEVAGEQYLVAQHGDKLQSTVYKLGHHGSKTSSTPILLDHAQSQVGLVSSGRRNRYGHPHKGILAACENRRMQVFRTDQHGAITLRSDGQDLNIHTFL